MTVRPGRVTVPCRGLFFASKVAVGTLVALAAQTPVVIAAGNLAIRRHDA
ncbi:hypothetical protein [Actinoplanes subglobosus]|uniref:Uncharacterized protein n=1 Tax=Actinoplanes subglobosus TaxID=1547892 RepID=A0ABV8IKR7_9ACTN